MKGGVLTVVLCTVVLLPLCVGDCSKHNKHASDEFSEQVAVREKQSKDGDSSMQLRVNEGSYEILENGAGKFAVDIEDSPIASANVDTVVMDPIEMDPIATGEVEDGGYKVYCPGPPRFGNIVLRIRRPDCDVNQMDEWFGNAILEKNETKSIHISAYRREGPRQVEARTWHIKAFPIRWDPGELMGAELPIETITCKMTECTVSCPPVEGASNFAPASGVTIRIEGEAAGEDAAWETVTGGGLSSREVEAEVCDEQGKEQGANSKEKKKSGNGRRAAPSPPRRTLSVMQMSLAGPVANGRTEMCELLSASFKESEEGWADVEDVDARIEVLEGKLKKAKLEQRNLREATKKRNVRVRTKLPESEETTVQFMECFPVRYRFPSLSATGGAAPYEEVDIRPIRMTLA